MKRVLLLCVATLCVASSFAKVTLNSIWSDDMVIQRNWDVEFRGRSTAKEVVITPSWCDKSYTAKVGAEGKWCVKIPTGDAGVGYTVLFDDGDKLTLNNVLLGDVWLCLGQSNMVMKLSGMNQGMPVYGATDALMEANASYPMRLYETIVSPSDEPQESVKGRWMTTSPQDVLNFSAAAYFFGKRLVEALDVPIGLVVIARGGSRIESWMTREAIETAGVDYDKWIKANKKDVRLQQLMGQSVFYNGMLCPVEGLAVKGALWYQGEANIYNAQEYMTLFPSFAKLIRSHFDGGGDFPIYYAQIAPFYGADEASSRVEMREVMAKLNSIVPRSEMITLTDIGELRSIHPRYKKPVGDRFAMAALGDTYGYKRMVYQVPEFIEQKIGECKYISKYGIYLKFEKGMSQQGFYFTDGEPSKLFEVAGEDRKFYPAEVTNLTRDNDYQLFVWSDQVANPVAVRYGFKDYVKGDIYGIGGMPLSSFRSDDWDL
ncbi:MAG: sialate O-acetylesterase [Rikenellaceae bacterium]